MLEAEMQREMQFDEEKTTCKTLILHMQKLLDREAATTTAASSNGIHVGVVPQRSQSSPAATSTGLTPNARLANADRECECTCVSALGRIHMLRNVILMAAQLVGKIHR